MTISTEEKSAIYEKYHAKIYGYLLSKIGDTYTAEDLCSDVFLKITEKIETFDENKASLSTWIYTVARNTLTDYYRTRRVFEEVPETYADGSDIEESMISEEMLETLAAALESLPERERDIIVLRYYDGRKLRDIAADMGISYAYVKVLQNKAMEKIRKFF